MTATSQPNLVECVQFRTIIETKNPQRARRFVNRHPDIQPYLGPFIAYAASIGRHDVCAYLVHDDDAMAFQCIGMHEETDRADHVMAYALEHEDAFIACAICDTSPAYAYKFLAAGLTSPHQEFCRAVGMHYVWEMHDYCDDTNMDPSFIAEFGTYSRYLRCNGSPIDVAD